MGESPFSLRGGRGRQRSAVKNARRFVADLLEHASDGAVFFRDAFLTRGVCSLADAGNERERAIECANDFADADLIGCTPELITAARPLPARPFSRKLRP